jgi:hypothetical protein
MPPDPGETRQIAVQDVDVAAPARPRDLLSVSAAPRRIARREDEPCPATRQLDRRRPPDATGGAGEEAGTALDSTSRACPCPAMFSLSETAQRLMIEEPGVDGHAAVIGYVAARPFKPDTVARPS